MTDYKQRRRPRPGVLAGALALTLLVGAATVAEAGPVREPGPAPRSAAASGPVQMAGLKLCLPVSRCLSEKKAEPRPRVRDKRGRPRVRDKRRQTTKKGHCRVFDARTGRCRVMDYR